MPMRLDIKRVLSSRSDRVKAVDLHPKEPWLLVSLYNGKINIWNYETQNIIKTFDNTDLPVRCVRFIHRKNWVVAGADDMIIRVMNYNTLDKVHQFEAHSDYIRSLAPHPTLPYLLSSSDDMTIKCWDWDNGWQLKQQFDGHTHYVMMVTFNPKDANQFASASLDRTIKVWTLGMPTANFTLEGHDKGVNCVGYYPSGEKPQIISGADDRAVKIWDYQTRSCVATLEAHTQNVSAVMFHPELPVILTGSEDGTVRIWNSKTYRLENTLNYGLERVWSMVGLRGSHVVAIGYDEGAIMIKMGREDPVLSMDGSGKVVFAKHNEVQQANLKALTAESMVDGERLPMALKDMGSAEIYPQTISHNPNGRFIVVCGDGEYVIYTALAWRNKSYGQALEFVWAVDSSDYAVRESSSRVKLFSNFKEKHVIKTDFSAEGIFGGQLLGVRSSNFLVFYEWENLTLVRRIDIVAKSVIWSEDGSMMAICTENSFFVLKYDKAATTRAIAAGQVTDEGVEEAFDVAGEVNETVRTGCWVGDCFIYTNAANRLNYYVGGEIVTVAHLDRPMYILGYLNQFSRVFLADRDMNITTYTVVRAVLDYQTAVMRKDLEAADSILPSIPEDQRDRVASFLEKQGFKEQALLVTNDPHQQFELAMSLKKTQMCYELAERHDNVAWWRQLGELALTHWQFGLAEECMKHAKDYSGLLMLYSSAGNKNGLLQLANVARSRGQLNIAFTCYFQTGALLDCHAMLMEKQRFAEAAFFARTYLPSKVNDTTEAWKESLRAKGWHKAADAIASPAEYGNLFPEIEDAGKAEFLLASYLSQDNPAQSYPQHKEDIHRDLLTEAKSADPSRLQGSMPAPSGGAAQEAVPGEGLTNGVMQDLSAPTPPEHTINKPTPTLPPPKMEPREEPAALEEPLIDTGGEFDAVPDATAQPPAPTEQPRAVPQAAPAEAPAPAAAQNTLIDFDDDDLDLDAEEFNVEGEDFNADALGDDEDDLLKEW
eukprot:Clim_evm26s33 gene=Clim_evmTU26s33